MAHSNVFRTYLIIAVIIAAIIGAFSTLGGLYLSNRLGFQKEISTKEIPNKQPELSSTDKVPLNSTEEASQSDTSSAADPVYWKQKDGLYFMYHEGNRIDEFTNSAWSGKDLLVYDQRNKRTFLFEDFEARNDNKLRLAKDLGLDKAYWKQRDNKYYMYYEGNRVDEYTTSSWSDSDLLVYDKKNKKTFLLENFEKLDDNVLRGAKEMKK